MSNRTRRVALDDSSVNAWTVRDSFVDLTNTPYFVIPGINVLINIGGNDEIFNTITVWAAGIVSLGDVTQDQIDFMALELDVFPNPAEGNPGFPGAFFAVAYIDNTAASRIQNFDYAYGLTDFPDPAGQLDYVPAAFVAFGFSQDDSVPQIVFGTDGFTIFNQASFPLTIGYSIGGSVARTDADILDFDTYPDFLTQNGGDGTDTLNGSSYRDSLIGNGGSDILNGFDGNDLLAGGAGADQINGGNGFDIADYSLSAASVNINLATGVFSGGDAAGDTFSGIEGVTGSAFDDILTGGGQSDNLTGGDGNDLIDGGSNADFLVGGAGADTLLGSGGSDTLIGGTGADVLNGGEAIDFAVYFSSQQGVTVDLNAATASGGDAQGDTLFNIENVGGSGLADRLTGNSLNNVLVGEDGDDLLSGLGASDTLIGGTGRDTLSGDGGDDSLFGNDDDDVLIGGAGSDAMDGGTGNDTASYLLSSAGVSINLLTNVFSGGHAVGDTLTDIESVEGSAFADAITGNSFNNVIEGGAGGDTLNGGNGTDTLSYRLSTAGVSVNLLSGAVSGGHAAGDIISNFEWIIGSAQADQLTGNNNANTIAGGDGIDTINGLGGADNLSGESGDDNLFGGDGSDVLFGGTGRDVLDGGNEGDRLDGGADDDTLRGGAGGDTLIGGAGADRLEGGDNFASSDRASYLSSAAGVIANLATGQGNGGDAAGDILIGIEDLEGSNFADQLTGDDNANFLIGQGGNDLLIGGGGDDSLYGNGGDDVISGGAGADYIEGDNEFETASFDRVDYSTSSGAVNVDLAEAFQTGGDAEGDIFYTNSFFSDFGDLIEFFSIDAVTGSGFADALRGNGLNNVIEGGGGGDTLNGRGGIDTLSYVGSNQAVTVNLATNTASGGHAQGDVILNFENLTGSDFNDALTGNALANSLIGGKGNDVLAGREGDDLLSGGVGQDTLDGGTGFDIVSYAGLANAVTANLSTGFTQKTRGGGTEILLGIEGIIGTAFDDGLTGDKENNRLEAGNGNDTIIGGRGNDVLLGGDGNDVFRYSTGDGQDSIDGGAGFDTIRAVAAGARLSFATVTGIELISAAGFANVNLFGTAGVDVINLTGVTLDGIGFIDAGNGNDVVIGSAGNDVIRAGNGADLLTGGDGDDRFLFQRVSDGLAASFDTITDFVQGSDIIDLAGVDANTAINGNQAFAFIGNTAFSGLAGELRATRSQNSGITRLQGDTNGDGLADFFLQLRGLYVITTDDLVL